MAKVTQIAATVPGLMTNASPASLAFVGRKSKPFGICVLHSDSEVCDVKIVVVLVIVVYGAAEVKIVAVLVIVVRSAGEVKIVAEITTAPITMAAAMIV